MALGDVIKGAGTGATMGSAFGPLGTLAGGVIGGAAGGLFGRENKETPMQGKQRELVDQLLASLQGEGPYSNLFNVDEGSFQRSFVDPMKQKFSSQIAPQIQQSYIASGQQRGTGLDDTLTRAGVNMDQLLNQYYYQQQQDAMNRQLKGIGGILGMKQGAPATPSVGQAAMQGLGGYLQSDRFGSNLDDVIKYYQNKGADRKGFEDTRGSNELTDYTAPLGRRNQVYNPYTGTQE